MSYSKETNATTQVAVHLGGAMGSLHVPRLTISADVEIPDDLGIGELHVVYDREANEIADALIGHLPGAVVDRVLVRLLERHASSLRVIHDGLFGVEYGGHRDEAKR